MGWPKRQRGEEGNQRSLSLAHRDRKLGLSVSKSIRFREGTMATPTLVTITGQLRDTPTTGDATVTIAFKSKQLLRHTDGTVIEPFKITAVLMPLVLSLSRYRPPMTRHGLRRAGRTV
jgi:hypothetical protein